MKNTQEAINLITNITEQLEEGQWNKLDKVAMVRLAITATALVDKVKELVRTDLQNGETIKGAHLGKDSVTSSVTDWPAVKAYMVKTYNSNPGELDKFATISMSNLYTLDRTQSGKASKKNDEIKSTYSKYISNTSRQGSLKLG